MERSADRWADADRIFSQALEAAGSAREAIIRDCCKGDTELERVVRELLADCERADAWLDDAARAAEGPLWEGLLGDLADENPSKPGGVRHDPARVGPYRILERIGRGGMGSVYLAERDDPDLPQRVAIKLLRRGLDSEDIVARFLAERRILASLSHPAIARLTDGGMTADGRPYLVMEYVRGVPIDEYSDSRRLSLEERLDLFLVVASAVQHAHRNLVIHRDLKPANILVTDQRVVKLLDFGIAKLLDDSAARVDQPLTRPGLRLLTPEYASPEQLRGEVVTTASDLFQLGLLLYELLSGLRPRDGPPDGSLTDEEVIPPSVAVRRADDGVTPARLSDLEAICDARRVDAKRLRGALRGDLDTIVLTALHPDPERRYGSARELAEDVRRHLRGRPVTAHGDTWTYRTRKFLTRNRWFAPTATLVAALAATYLVTAERHSRQVEFERNVAREEADRAEEVKQLLVDILRSPDPFASEADRQGRNVSVREALTSGADRVRSELANRPELQTEILGTISDVLGNLDLVPEALTLREEVLTEETRLYGADSPQVAASLGRLGALLRRQGLPDSADTVLSRHVRATVEAHGPRDPLVAAGLVELASVHRLLGRFEEARTEIEEAVAIYRTANPVPDLSLAGALEELTELELEHGRVEEAERTAREAVWLRTRAVGDAHPTTALARIRLALVLYAERDYGGAEREYRQALPILERELGADHWLTSGSLNDFALLLSRMGDHSGAERVHRRLLEIRRAKHGEMSEAVAETYQNLAVAVARQERYAEAEPLHRAAHDTYLAVFGPNHYLVAYPLLSLVHLQLDQGDFVEAEGTARDATEILRKGLPEGHFAAAMGECRWGRALAGQGRDEEAERLLLSSARQLVASTQVPVEYEWECLEATVSVLKRTGGAAKAATFEARLARLSAEARVPPSD